MITDEVPKHLLWRIESNCRNIEKQLVWDHRYSVLFYIIILSFGLSLVTPFSFLCLAVSLNSLRTVYSKRQVVLSEQELENDSSEELEELEEGSIVLENEKSEEQTEEPKEQPKYPKEQIELKKATTHPQPTSTTSTHTKEDLGLDPIYTPPPTTDRVEAYQLIGCGYRLIVSSGPKKFRTYRVMPGKEYNHAWDIASVLRIARYEGRREAPVIVGVAFQDFGTGYSVLDPKLYTSPRRGKNMPVTYVKVWWGDGGVSWETRSDVRSLFGRVRADAMVFEKVGKFEEDAVAYKKRNPGWNKKAGSKVKVGDMGS